MDKWDMEVEVGVAGASGWLGEFSLGFGVIPV